MKFRKVISAVLAVVMIISLIPAQVFAADDGLYTLSDGSIKVIVSGKNGGFLIQTEEGDSLIKSDNNKKLLHHRDAYDTSFTTFRVTEKDGTEKDYLFGGSYGFLGLASSEVTTSQDATGISSVWSVDDLTFTQRIELPGAGANEHGAVLVSYSAAKASGEPVDVKARLLFDTALGEQDYAYYEVVDQYGEYRSIEKETVITEADYIPANYFGYDDNMNPEITAYNMYTGQKPYQIAFGHWNNLASSLFDFAPDSSMTFTNQFNEAYLTADSAVGMYFDMGEVSQSEVKSFSTYYGVYSNNNVSDNDALAINLTAPAELTLSADKTTYLPGGDGLANGVFKVQTQINNYVSDTAKNYESVTVAAYASNGIQPLDDNGNPMSSTPTYLEPYTVLFTDFVVGQTQTKDFLFKADVGEVSEFRKIELRAFDTSDGNNMMTADNMIGSKSFYVLCPGGNGKLPEVIFTAMNPPIIYNEGQRNLFVSGKNFNLLVDKSQYALRAYSASGDLIYDIPSEQIVFTQKDGVDSMTVMLTEEMQVGTYELVFDWTGEPPSGLKKRMTAPALQFTVSDDKQYKNNYYGIAAVVQEGSGGNATYYINMYKTEAEYNADKSNYEEVLLTFKGEFEKTDIEGETIYRATSVKLGDKADNVVVVNDCIDFENGTVTLRYSNEGILVDFDGDLYTSVKRSKIWSGEATFTEIRQGAEYGLVPYNNDGERMDGDYGQQITLLWPCGLSIAQNISGMAFNLTFGSMGIIYDVNGKHFSNVDKSTPVKGKVVSFSASLDLSFLVPNAGRSSKDVNWASIAASFGSEMTSTELRNKWTGIDMINHSYNGLHYKDNRTKDGQGSVMVQDILYGCGEGLMGVNFDVDLVLPGYFDAMPSLIGHLAVNTISGYEIGVDGACQFGTLEVEASIAVKDANGVPIPDKLYFAIMGFEPGINVDGFGVLWITGGGGGIDKLYDTIFGGSSIPPLKIMLTVSFDILKTLAARVDLSLSLRGLSLTAKDVKVKYLNVPVLNRAQLAFEWYPEFYFMASVDANILGVIQGQGYIVILNNDDYDAFVEFFIRAGIMIPGKVPIIGGMQIGGVDLGANNQKIWGVVRALGAELGVTYYWGGDVDFGTGSAVSKPSFPDLLGHEDIPVYYDEETGRTLYMHVGNNLSHVSAAVIIGENSEPVLLGADRTIASYIEKTTHKLTLGAFNDTDAALVISYPAASKEEAQSYAEQIRIGEQALTFYNVDEANENTANANLVYQDDTQTAEVNVVFSKADEFEKTHTITTPVASNLALYDINPVPKLTSLTKTVSGNNITVNWSGNMIEQLDSVMFALTDDPDGGVDANIYPIGYEQYIYSGGAKTSEFAFPADLPTGTYYLQAVYSKEDIINERIVDSTPIEYTNSNQPSSPSSVTAVNGGDYMFDITVEKSNTDDFDGYIVNVYEEDSENIGSYILSDICNLVFEKDSEGNIPKMSAGGYFEVPIVDDEGNQTGTELKGLAPGKAYSIGVTAFKNVTDTEGEVIAQVLSDEVRTAQTITLKTPTPPVVTLTNKTAFQTLFRTQDGLTEQIKIDTFAVNDLEFTVEANTGVTGTWTLNDTESGSFTNGATLSFTDLDDGDYKLTLTGEDADGDGFIITKSFAVDTLPPVLLLSSPVNGGFFNGDGSITVSGVTESDARLTIYVDGESRAEGKTITELGGTIDSAGVFTFTLPGVPSKSAQTVVISAEDAMQNISEVTTATVYNEGLAQIESLTIYADGQSYSGNNIPTGTDGISAKLSLGVNTPSGTFLLEDDDPVTWSVQSVLGSATVDDKHILTAGADSMGTILAQFFVADVDDAATQEGYVGSMYASATFGGENNEVMAGLKNISVSSDLGGTVSGSGYYAPGETVTLTATADSKYKFVGWEIISGSVTLSSLTDATITFVVPDEDIEIKAKFELTSTSSGRGGGSSTVKNAGQVNGTKDKVYSFNLPQNTDGTNYAPYYYENGKKVYVKMSAEIEGKMYFIAPVNAVYYLAENKVVFDDIGGHWAEENIIYAAAREIFSGISETTFAPDSNMTRAMFVTVLGRLAGVTADMNRTSDFTDVPEGQWYTPYVAWAAENKIVEGYGNDLFGPDDLVTREQMCAIITRYLKAEGYELTVQAEAADFTDSDSISEWAKEAVNYCQTRELIVGKDNNRFAPQDNSTRAEAATILRRLIEKVLMAKK